MTKFGVYQIHGVSEFARVDEIAAISHPERIASHTASYIDDCTSNSHFNLFNFIEDEEAQFLVESINHHYLTERCIWLVMMQLLGYL